MLTAARVRHLCFGSVTPEEAVYLNINLALTLLTAWSSVTFFHPDEHFQVLEFTGYKFGFTSADALPWEYAARIRPWLQPALYFVLIEAARCFGIEDRFALAFVLRVASGLLACVALRAIWRIARHWPGHDTERTRRIRFLALAGFLPYLAVRTSSENVATSFLLLGLSLVMGGRPPEGEQLTPLSAGTALGAGALFGLAFEARYQMAFMLAGLVLWLALVGGVGWRKLAAMGLGGLSVVALAAPVDRWGYGVWTFPAWSYLRVNLCEHVAARFGTYPFYAYAYLLLPNVFGPVMLPLLVAALAGWLRHPRHVVTFCTLPFVLGHSVLAHKEERFMFPAAILSLLAASLAFEPSLSPAATRFGGWLRKRGGRLASAFGRLQSTRAFRAMLVCNFGAMGLLASYPLGWHQHVTFYRWVEATLRQGPARFVSETPELVPIPSTGLPSKSHAARSFTRSSRAGSSAGSRR